MFVKIFEELLVPHTFSQINAMIDIPLPIPRNINAANKDVYVEKCIKIDTF